MSGKLCKAHTMEPIDAVCTALTGLSFRWQIKQSGVLPQATEDDDSEICQRLQHGPSRISDIGHKPDFSLDVQRTNRRYVPCPETDRQLQFRAEFPAIFRCQRRHVLLSQIHLGIGIEKRLLPTADPSPGNTAPPSYVRTSIRHRPDPPLDCDARPRLRRHQIRHLPGQRHLRLRGLLPLRIRCVESLSLVMLR